MSEHLQDTQVAFDSVAADYDGPLGNNALIQQIRFLTMRAVVENIPSGSPVIDLGCGTGLDVQYLACQGYHLTAIDWSPEMVKRTRERIEHAGLQDQAAVHHLGIHELDRLPAGVFAGAYSDLGAINCVPDLAMAARSINRILRPGGLLIASVIGKICPWEIAAFVLKGQGRRARIRFTREFVQVPLNGRTIWTHYFTPREFADSFARAGFHLVSRCALGLFVPPPYMIRFTERHTVLTRRLLSLDDRVRGWPLFRDLGDHFLIIMRKTA